MFQSIEKGYAVTLDKIETYVNGLSPPYAGTNCYEICKKFVDEIVLVSDEEIKQASVELFTKHKLVVEAAGSASFAAIISKKGNYLKQMKGKNIVAILSGGNTSAEDFSIVLKRGF